MTKAIIFFSSFLFLCGFTSFSQEYNNAQNIKVVQEQEAYYPKGEQALFIYFYENIKYSKEAIDNKANGEVMLSFFVEADSSITNVQIFSNIGYGIDQQAVELLKKLKYAPSIQNGVKLRQNVMLSIPIRADIKN